MMHVLAGDNHRLKINSLIEEVDRYRVDAFKDLPAQQRGKLGQYPTPPAIAKFMASLFETMPPFVRLLDAGAGIGSLTAAFVANACSRQQKPRQITATTFEIDPILSDHLKTTFEICEKHSRMANIDFSGNLRTDDFVADAVATLQGALFGGGERYNCAILNPPYKKIHTASGHRQLLRAVGIETSNIYTGFLALAIMLLDEGAEMVAIVPRSFCNGPYFQPFRELLLAEMDIRRIHIFESRTESFKDDDVLQENIIFHAVKTRSKSKKVLISSSEGPTDIPNIREVTPSELVHPSDANRFIRIVADKAGGDIAEKIRQLPATLAGLDINVSTGRVVDFRSRDDLRMQAGLDDVPLIYPMHFADGWIDWPRPHPKKANAIAVSPASTPWFIPNSIYVLVKRFSAKEEKRRIMAAIYDPTKIKAAQVGFENHLNYYHIKGAGLPMALAKGITLFLNSTLVDEFFRQFNGHTQVNATDLRNLPYPSREQLEALGNRIKDQFPVQEEIDRIVERELWQNGQEMSWSNGR